MADASREEKLKAARETFKQLQKKKAGGKAAGPKAKKPKDDEPKEAEQPVSSTEQTAPEVASPEPQREQSPVSTLTEIPVAESNKEDPAIQELQSQLSDKDSQITSLQEQLSALKSQDEKYKRDVAQYSSAISSKDKEIALLKSSDTEKDSLISSLQLELGQLQSQLTSLKESNTSAPSAEQFALLTTELDSLRSQLSSTEESAKSSQKELHSLQGKYTALEKDTKTTHETLVSLRNEHAKLKETHSGEIQKSRVSHSRAAELQLENKTLLSRVEELKQKVVSLTSEKVELIDRSDTLEKELYKLRKQVQSSNTAGESGDRGSIELNTELDQLIRGQETRQAIRETNQRRYSQFVGQSTGEGDTMREINERRLKKGKDSGEFGREREVGFVIDLIAVGGGCGMCVGEVLTL